MANTTPPKKIFLSYAWANVNVADEIDNDFKAVGITFQRDVRDIAFAGSIKDFMNRIGKSDFVVMLISDEYIKSENCMYEVTELLGAHEFEGRILPVIVNNAPVFKRDDHKKYYQHWKDELQKVSDLHDEFGNEKTLEDKRKIQSIQDYLGRFFQKITDLKSETFDELKRRNYNPMLDKMGIEGKDVLEKVLEILKIEDKEEQEIAFDAIQENNPKNKYILFYRGNMAYVNREYKKAKKYYEDLIHSYPDLASAHCNLAKVLAEHFQNYTQARVHYENAIVIDSSYLYAYNSLAILVSEHFQEYELAREYYEKAIEVAPRYADVHYNLARLHQDYFKDYAKARTYYEKTIEIDPSFSFAYNNLGIILEKHFGDFVQARAIYEKAIENDPNYSVGYYNLAQLLIKQFGDVEEAKKLIRKSVDIVLQDENTRRFFQGLIDSQTVLKHKE